MHLSDDVYCTFLLILQMEYCYLVLTLKLINYGRDGSKEKL